MAVLPINVGETCSDATLRRALQPLPPGEAVTIMVHGFKFCPSEPRHSPHTHILSDSPRPGCWKARSWPRQLRLTGPDKLGIAFGWPARGSIWQAYGRVPAAASDLSRLLAAIHRIDPDRPVTIIGHSLGARIALLSLAFAPAGQVQRMILMSPAVFCAEAGRTMQSPAGRAVEVFSVTGRENTLFDLLLRAAFPLAGPTLGRGGPCVANWLDLTLDRPAALNAMRDLGHRIAPPKARICHWSGYLRPGIFGLYRAILQRPSETPMPLLRARLEPGQKRPAFWFRPRFPGGGAQRAAGVDPRRRC